MIGLGALSSESALATTNALSPGQRIERDVRDQRLVELLDVHAAVVRERHRRRPEPRRVGDREVDFVLRRHRALEGDAVRLGRLIAVTVLDEVQPLLLLERGLQVARAAEEPGLALLADATLEQRLDEHRAVAIDQRLDLLLARVRAEHLRDGKAGKAEELGAVQHACDLHVGLRGNTRVLRRGCQRPGRPGPPVLCAMVRRPSGGRSPQRIPPPATSAARAVAS